MVKHPGQHEYQMSFFLHLWLEGEDPQTWRGRVNDGDGCHSGAFEDEQALLGFIREQLSRRSICLPRKASKRLEIDREGEVLSVTTVGVKKT